MTSITLSRDQGTRLLHSLQHLHTLHGPCDGLTCPHAAVLQELEGMIYLASVPDHPCWRGPTRCPSCGEIVSSVFDHVDGCPQDDPEFQAVAPFPCQDPHDLADALLRLTTSPPLGNTSGVDDARWEKFKATAVTTYSLDTCKVCSTKMVNPKEAEKEGWKIVMWWCPTCKENWSIASLIRLCAACGAALPSTTSAGTNICGRCSL